MNRKLFYDSIRASLFKKLSAKQVAGMEAVLNEWDRRGFLDQRWLAYILGTIYHETGAKMNPTPEKGGEAYLRSKKYYPYYGRDLVHTTWRANYQKVKAFTGIDVVANPDLIANLPVAAATAIEFMDKGYYTGKKLSHYFNDKKEDWFNARRIINGTDKASLVGGYAKLFYEAIKNS
jgi:hypothetical protein